MHGPVQIHIAIEFCDLRRLLFTFTFHHQALDVKLRNMVRRTLYELYAGHIASRMLKR